MYFDSRIHLVLVSYVIILVLHANLYVRLFPKLNDYISFEIALKGKTLIVKKRHYLNIELVCHHANATFELAISVYSKMNTVRFTYIFIRKKTFNKRPWYD